MARRLELRLRVAAREHALERTAVVAGAYQMDEPRQVHDQPLRSRVRDLEVGLRLAVAREAAGVVPVLVDADVHPVLPRHCTGYTDQDGLKGGIVRAAEAITASERLTLKDTSRFKDPADLTCERYVAMQARERDLAERAALPAEALAYRTVSARYLERLLPRGGGHPLHRDRRRQRAVEELKK